ncbi:MAG: TIGR04325 family methyltransferase [Nitrospiraceae bacterium]|nr:TIGR04325 family methyltransferase [Nitrospiraceae bacterium]
MPRHKWIPFVFSSWLQTIVARYGFFGNYKCWADARKRSGGYDADIIVEKVKNALLQVKKGAAVYERDSVLFLKIQYSWPLLSAILWIASQNNNTLRLIDFGGSMGSSYYQNRFFLSHLSELTWSIVEQKAFVDCGKRHFADDHLKFFYSLQECLATGPYQAILFSSVIQYIDKPYELLSEVMDHDFEYILFDRTPFLIKGKDRITVQRVPPGIYDASYPAWFFNPEKFLGFMRAKYDLMADCESNDRANIRSVFKGFIFRRKKRESGD